MIIRVKYSELKSTGNFSNKSAGVEIEAEVDKRDFPKAFDWLWQKAKNEVRRQLEESNVPQFVDGDDIPF